MMKSDMTVKGAPRFRYDLLKYSLSGSHNFIMIGF